MPARLLLVDDEAELAALLKKYLERLGYEVDSCVTPEAALALFEKDPPRYSVVLTDLTLPGMTGAAMIDRMRALRPSLPAIISSGYPYEPQSKGVRFLQKPFLPKMLADVLEQMLKKPPTQ